MTDTQALRDLLAACQSGSSDWTPEAVTEDDFDDWSPDVAALMAAMTNAIPALLDETDALRRVADAAADHGVCSCADYGGPRPLGNGSFYHYIGCDNDPELRAALEAKP